jgi:hypothetical protein
VLAKFDSAPSRQRTSYCVTGNLRTAQSRHFPGNPMGMQLWGSHQAIYCDFFMINPAYDFSPYATAGVPASVPSGQDGQHGRAASVLWRA